jgi:hypothetical protein
MSSRKAVLPFGVSDAVVSIGDKASLHQAATAGEMQNLKKINVASS